MEVLPKRGAFFELVAYRRVVKFVTIVFMGSPK